MLRGNLSTRPFYNSRIVGVALGVATALLLAFTAFNAWQLVSLTRQKTELDAQIRADDATTASLRAGTQAIRQQLAGAEVSGVQSAASEANRLIDRRAFSWTGLFNRFEATLPPDVRITAVQPQTGRGGEMVVAISVVSRRIEDLDAFIDRLEATGAFKGVISREDQASDDGLLSVIQAFYTPPPLEVPPAPNSGPAAAPPAVPPAAAAEAGR
jgi:hypothetical protein